MLGLVPDLEGFVGLSSEGNQPLGKLSSRFLTIDLKQLLAEDRLLVRCLAVTYQDWHVHQNLHCMTTQQMKENDPARGVGLHVAKAVSTQGPIAAAVPKNSKFTHCEENF